MTVSPAVRIERQTDRERESEKESVTQCCECQNKLGAAFAALSIELIMLNRKLLNLPAFCGGNISALILQ